MSISGEGPFPNPERQTKRRIGIVTILSSHENTYLLLLKSVSRGEWEIPGGVYEPGQTDVFKELTEETGLDLGVFKTRALDWSRQEIDANTKTLLGGSGNKQPIQNNYYQAVTVVEDLPDITLSPEHTDYLYVRLPKSSTHSLQYQLLTRKLVLSRRKPESHVVKLINTTNDHVVEGQKPNISEVSAKGITKFAERLLIDPPF